MRSFASIATFATLAFASVVSALPIVNVANLPGAVSLPKVEIAARNNVADLTSRIVVDDAVSHVVADITTRDSPLSVAEILSQVTTTIAPLASNLTATVSAQHLDVKAIVPIVLDVLGQVLDIVKTAVADVQTSLNEAIPPLVLNGEVLSVPAIAKLVGSLIVTIVELVGVIFNVLGDVDQEVLTVVGNILDAVVAILSLILPVVKDLLAVIMPIVEPLLPILSKLGFTTMSNVLSIAM